MSSWFKSIASHQLYQTPYITINLIIMQNVIAITIGVCSHYVFKSGASPVSKLVIDIIAWSF